MTPGQEETYLVDQINLPARNRRDMRAACSLQFDLKGKDLVQLRTDLSAVRGGNVLTEIENSIRDALRGAYQTVLFSGHIGSGKTTELRWLQSGLMKTKEDRCFHVLWIDAQQYLDLNTVQLPEFLLSIFSALVEDPILGLNINTFPSAKKLWKSVRSWLKSVGVELEAEIPVGVAKLKLKLKNEFGFQHSSSQALQKEITEILLTLSDVLREARSLLNKQGVEDLVIIVDNLEKILLTTFNPPQGTARNSHDLFFIEQLPVVQQLQAHLVLTVPISMHFNHNRLRQVFLNPIVEVLPMVPVHHQGKPDEPHLNGLNCLRKLLAQRVDLDVLFADEKAIFHAISLSGGVIRDLFSILLGAVSFKPELKLTLGDIDGSVRSQVSSYERMLGGKSYLPSLHHVASTGGFPVGFPDEDKRQLLYNLVVLEYNGVTWYDVHPLARRTQAFKHAAPPPASTP